MRKIKYYTHLLLNHKYNVLFHCLLSFMIFFILKEGHYACCMNETSIPLIAEPKVPVVRGIQLLTPLQIEVSKFLHDAEIMEDQSKIIMKQEMTINTLKTENVLQKRGIQSYQISHKNLIRNLSSQQTKYFNLLNQPESQRITFTGLDGIPKERYIVIPEEYNRVRSQYYSAQLTNLCFGVIGISALVLGGIYLWKHTGDMSTIKGSPEVQAWARDYLDKISTL